MFSSSFFKRNRDNVASSVENALVCISGHVALQESADVAFPFRQDSSFWYVTGINEPDLVLLIDTVSGQSSLLVHKQNEYQKEWDGMKDMSHLALVSGINDIQPISTLEFRLKEAKNKKMRIAYLAPLPERVEPYGFYANPARKILENTIKKYEPEPIDVRSSLARLRQVKQEVEISAIQQAINVTAETLKEVKSNLDKYATEKEVENAITSGFFSRQSQGNAYEPIIASGGNASIIHYNTNVDILHKETFLLLDVGAKVQGYAADISRTWRVGSVDKRHKDLYSVILDIQNYAFSILKEGVVLKDYQVTVENYAKKCFKHVGVEIKNYPHGFSHFLGLDVHDAGLYDEPLAAGSVITVEPGIYLPKEQIGIRVEDDVMITEKGIKNLSEHIPKVL